RTAYRICRGRNDAAGMALCREKLQAVPAMMARAEARTSRLGWAIQDLPDLTLPPDYPGLRLEN
ncbi:MAG: hypothetical protein J5927_07985, partial [Oscillospiraceae bacterium]|nr:hypothetical protein [Oscillospiraceae bacterium]